MQVIETEGLTKSYGTARGIEDVTFSVQPGEVFGFLGPNGAGKTTTIRTLLDLLHPTGGTARLFGLDSRRDSVEIRSRLETCRGTSATARRHPASRRFACSPASAASTGSGGRRSWRSGSGRTCIGRSGSSPGGTGRRWG